MFGIKVEPQDRLEIARLRARWADLAYTTARADRPRAEAAIIAMYGAAGYGPPTKITWVESPTALVSAMPKRSRVMGRGESRYANVINSQLKKFVSDIITGPDKPLFWDVTQGYFTANRDTWSRRVWRLADIMRPWPIGGRGGRLGLPNVFVPDVNATWDLALLEFFGRRMRKAQRQLLRPHLELARYAHWMTPQRNSCVVMDRPTRIKLDEDGHFHSEDGPALAYGESSKLWVWHGTVVPEAAITDPARINLWALEKAPRDAAYAMIERMGSERFVREFGALRSHEDETGILWQRPIVGPAGIWVWSCVQVKNGTLAPDGSVEQFYLTVPANLTTAREAVAWTYGMSAAEYEIDVRT